MAVSPEGLDEAAFGATFLKSEQRHKLREKCTPFYVTRTEFDKGNEYGPQILYTIVFKADGSGDKYILGLKDNDTRRKIAEQMQLKIDHANDCIGPYYLWLSRSNNGHDFWQMNAKPQENQVPAAPVSTPAPTPVAAAPVTPPVTDDDLPF